jgi:hypothetical protein
MRPPKASQSLYTRGTSTAGSFRLDGPRPSMTMTSTGQPAPCFSYSSPATVKWSVTR